MGHQEAWRTPSGGLENGGEPPGHLVADVLCGGAAAQVPGAHAVVERLLDGGLDGVCLGGEVERVAQHHGDGEDGADGVDDALARDVGGGAWGWAFGLAGGTRARRLAHGSCCSSLPARGFAGEPRGGGGGAHRGWARRCRCSSSCRRGCR